MISAAPVQAPVDFRLPPSPTSRTSPRVILSPALPSSFSTTILSPGATRYCLPPVRTTAHIGSSLALEFRFPRRVTLNKNPPRWGKRAAYGRVGGVSTAPDYW